MKVAASDYDGTLFRQQTIAEEDVQGVRDWRRAGHKFGVVSGRDYGMLIPQLHHYGVEYDYAVCNNGGIIRDQDGKVMYQGEIPPEALAGIIREPLVRHSFHFAFSAVDTTYICHEFDGSWIKREAQEWDFPLVAITEDQAGSLPEKVHQLSLGFPEPEQSVACAAVVNEHFGAHVHAFPNGCSLDITPAGVSKEQGLYKLLAVMGWEGAELYPIGDETNDLPMLEAFGGYTVDTAREAIKAHARQSFSSVGAMLEHLK